MPDNDKPEIHSVHSSWVEYGDDNYMNAEYPGAKFKFCGPGWYITKEETLLVQYAGVSGEDFNGKAATVGNFGKKMYRYEYFCRPDVLDELEALGTLPVFVGDRQVSAKANVAVNRKELRELAMAILTDEGNEQRDECAEGSWGGASGKTWRLLKQILDRAGMPDITQVVEAVDGRFYIPTGNEGDES